MKLNLLDIESFIKKNKLEQITSSQIFIAKDKLNPEGLLSESIFGMIGSNKRRLRFAYIDTKQTFFHPEVWKFINHLDPIFVEVLNDKNTFTFQDGQFIPDPKGETGFIFFIKNFRKINFKKLSTYKSKRKEITFIENNLNKILINKVLVLPAGLRDIHLSSSAHTKIQFSDITSLYRTLLQQIKLITDSELESSIIEHVMEQIQTSLVRINVWFKSRLKGKRGIIRSGIVKKTIDYSGRFVITTENQIPLGSIGIAWQNVLKLFEPFVLHELFKNEDGIGLKLIQQNLKKDKIVDVFTVKKFLTKIIPDPSDPI